MKNNYLPKHSKKTKIICTIGPASIQKKIIDKMDKAGMNGVRINTAYGNLDQYKSIIENVRDIAETPVIFDIKGPEIRLYSKEEKYVQENEFIKIGFKNEDIRFNHDFYDAIGPGDEVYIDNGKIWTRIVGKNEGIVKLKVIDGGKISNGKGVNIPNKDFAVSTLSERDLKIIKFAKELGVEYIALSFTRNAEDVRKVKESGYKGAIIAKIENSEGVKNFDEILEIAECIMIARGDLGVEIETERVPMIQKTIIKKCNQEGKTVITATEMLESMINDQIPSRAEVSDIANAILDGTDAIMLSGETSIGKYPIESVSMMSRIACETEKSVLSNVVDGKFINITDTISKAVQRISTSMPLDKIVAITRSGYTARMIARLKISQPIIAVTSDEIVKKQLKLVYGVYPMKMEYHKKDDPILVVAKKLHSKKMIEDKETVLFTAAFRTTQEHASNLIEIHNVSEFTHSEL